MRNECLEGYSDWSLQAVHVSQLDYGSYGFVDGKRATLFDLYNSEKFKQRENAFKFHNLVKDDIKLTWVTICDRVTNKESFRHQQLLDCLAPGADMDDSACHCHYRGYTEDADYVVIGKNKL